MTLDDMNFEIGDLSKAGIYAFLITSSFSVYILVEVVLLAL
jgi:hypothetical protein